MQNAVLLSKCLTRSQRCYAPRNLAVRRPGPFRQLLTLAIETSCDDTCVAVLERHEASQQAQADQTKSQHDDAADSTSRTSAASPKQQFRAQLHFNEKVTARNTGLGGIHPIEALESHQIHLAKLVERALLASPISPETHDLTKKIVCRDGTVRTKPDFVSVTRGPGMKGNLACGLDVAKGLAVAWQVPLVGVHHMQAHALTPRLINAITRSNESPANQPAFPFLTLLVSGGHTMLLYSTTLTEHKILASTTDVAIGDTLDKCGRLLLSEETKANVRDTAFGKYLSQYAFPNQKSFETWQIPARRGDEVTRPINQFGWLMKTPLYDTKRMEFSFSGIATRTESLLQEREDAIHGPLSSEERLLLARTAIGTAFEHLGSRTLLALENLKRDGITVRNLVVSGGVAANDFLRYYLQSMLAIRGFQDVSLIFPPVKYCTDNAAMIAWTGIEMYEAGYHSDLSISSLRKWSMDADAQDGGIMGVQGWHRLTTQPFL